MSGYLFSNPQIKKWKTMFFLSFLMNLILVAVIVMREQEVAEDKQEGHDIVAKSDNSAEGGDVVPDKTSGAGEIQKPENKPAKSNHIPGEYLKGSVLIEENFFSAFSQSETVATLSSETGIPNLANLLSAHIGRLLMWDMVLRNDVRKQDRIDFVFRVIPDEEKKKRSDMPDLIEIIAVDYSSKKFNKHIGVYRFRPEKAEEAKYYYKDGTMIEKIISPFSPIRKYFQVTSLLDDRAPKHEGVDYKALVGSPVYSTVDGTVSRKNWMTKYNGYCIEIEEKGKPFVYKYLHLAEVLVDVGQKVKPGDHIANSGNTGKTTAPHLHYQINLGQKGKVIDPFFHHKTVIEKLSGSDEENFRKIVVDIDHILNS